MDRIHLDSEELVLLSVLRGSHVCHKLQGEDCPIILVPSRLQHDTHL